MATAQTHRHDQSSTNSPSVDPPDLQQFVDFCAELTLDTGASFLVEEFQRTILRDYFSGATETLVLLPKKNGKSTLVAALALYHLLTTRDAECYIAASSREQAGIILKQARKFIKSSPALDRLFDMNKREIQSLADEGVVKVLASDVDTADGVIPTLAIVDELHRHKSADLYGVFRDGLGPRSGRMITISTAGDDEDSPLGKMRTAAYAMPTLKRDGAYVQARSADESFVMHEWALLPDENRDDMDVVVQANPASWQTTEALQRRHGSPSMTPWGWARFACGVWVAGENAAISPLDWAACGDELAAIPAGTEVDLGIDLGWKWDTTAIVPLWWKADDERIFDQPVIIEPPRDGTSTDPSVIEDALRDLKKKWRVRRVVLDPNAGGEQLAAWIERELGWKVTAHSQDPAPMSLAAERFAAAVRERKLIHPKDATFNNHVLMAAAKTSGEKWRFVKAPRSKKPIDAVIAAAMVHSVASELAKRKVKPRFEVLA